MFEDDTNVNEKNDKSFNIYYHAQYIIPKEPRLKATILKMFTSYAVVQLLGLFKCDSVINIIYHLLTGSCNQLNLVNCKIDSNINLLFILVKPEFSKHSSNSLINWFELCYFIIIYKIAKFYREMTNQHIHINWVYCSLKLVLISTMKIDFLY